MNFFSPPFDIYTIAASFVLILSLVEIGLFVVGASLSKLFHHDVAHDIDHGDFDIHDGVDSSDYSLDINSVNIFNFGKVPFFLILVCLAGFFGFSGIGIHLLLAKLGMSLSNLYVLPLSVLSSSLLTFSVTSLWSKWFPNEETYAVSEKEYIGLSGTVQLGSGDNKNAVEVALYDKHGVKHFVMAHVALPNVTIKEGEKVIIVAREKNKHFLVLPQLEAVVETSLEKEKYM